MVATHTSDGKKVTDTSNKHLQQNLLINQTLLIITTPIDPQIDDMVATSRASTIKLAMPHMTEFIGGTTIFPTRTGSQDIVSPHGPIDSVEVRNTKIFSTSVNGNLAKYGDYKPI